VVPFDPESVRSLPLSLLAEPVELPASVEGEETPLPTAESENPADVQPTSEESSERGTPAARKTTVPPTSVVPTSVVPTSVVPTAVLPTAVPPTAEPPTAVPPTAEPPTAIPPTAVPPTAEPPTAIPPTEEEKVTICHKGKNTLTIGISALPAHLAHGDTMGACP
jgi:hypothetical protein